METKRSLAGVTIWKQLAGSRDHITPLHLVPQRQGLQVGAGPCGFLKETPTYQEEPPFRQVPKSEGLVVPPCPPRQPEGVAGASWPGKTGGRGTEEEEGLRVGGCEPEPGCGDGGQQVGGSYCRPVQGQGGGHLPTSTSWSECGGAQGSPEQQ